MNLIAVLLVPIVIAAGSVWFSIQINNTNIEISKDQQRETLLKIYMDEITTLLLDKGLRDPNNTEAREIARTKTLLTLEQLDGMRKGKLVVFINNIGLINSSDTVIHLDMANLRGANLQQAGLTAANLSWVDLREANLVEADLFGAVLRGADLWRASMDKVNLEHTLVSNKQLSQAQSLGGAILPDGSTCLSEIPSECQFNEVNE